MGEAPPEILERKEKFKQSLAPFVELIGRKYVDEFFSYWTEMNDSKTKMRFEIEKKKKGVFEISKRLAKWKEKGDSGEFTKKGAAPEQPKKLSMPESYHR